MLPRRSLLTGLLAFPAALWPFKAEAKTPGPPKIAPNGVLFAEIYRDEWGYHLYRIDWQAWIHWPDDNLDPVKTVRSVLSNPTTKA